MIVYKAPNLEEIRQARKKRPVAYMLTVFGDESYNVEQRVFAVAGIVAPQEEWDELECAWLDRTKGIPFHATDCESDRGVYEGKPHKENLLLYRDLTTILANSHLLGYGVAMDLKGYRTYFPDSPSNIPYIHCFRILIDKFAEFTYNVAPMYKVKFTFDINLETNYCAGELYHIYSQCTDFTLRQYFGGISFDCANNSVGIQVADLWAREVMKETDRKLYRFDKYPEPRKSMTALLDTGRFKLMALTKIFFEDYRNNFTEIEAANGITQEDYAKWLGKNGLTDNATTRTKYLGYLNKINMRAPRG